jgi:hypothetical protein
MRTKNLLFLNALKSSGIRSMIMIIMAQKARGAYDCRGSTKKNHLPSIP